MAPVAGKLAGLATRSSARLVRHGNSCLYKHLGANQYQTNAHLFSLYMLLAGQR